MRATAVRESRLMPQVGLEQQPALVVRDVDFLEVHGLAVRRVTGRGEHQVDRPWHREVAPHVFVRRGDGLHDAGDRHAELAQDHGLEVRALDVLARQLEQRRRDGARREEADEHLELVVDRHRAVDADDLGTRPEQVAPAAVVAGRLVAEQARVDRQPVALVVEEAAMPRLGHLPVQRGDEAAAPARAHDQPVLDQLTVGFLHGAKAIGHDPRQLGLGRQPGSGRPVAARDGGQDGVAQHLIFRTAGRLRGGDAGADHLDHPPAIVYYGTNFDHVHRTTHFTFRPAASATLAYFSDSARMKAANSSGVLPTGSAAWVTRISRTLASLSASTAALCSFSSTGRGVPAGASRPNQLVKSNCSKPLVSAIAGTSGNDGERLPLVTAMALSCFDCRNGTTGGMPEMVSLTWPPTASVTAGWAPRYGT